MKGVSIWGKNTYIHTYTYLLWAYIHYIISSCLDITKYLGGDFKVIYHQRLVLVTNMGGLYAPCIHLFIYTFHSRFF